MQSDRIQQRINTFLDEADEAAARSDWARVRDRAQNVLAFDPENSEALSYIAAADRAGIAASRFRVADGVGQDSDGQPDTNQAFSSQSALEARPARPEPTSFVNGRYEVKRLLGEGGKKRVFLCHDTKLDRDVAFALIKTEGLDAEGDTRIRREAQAMGRLGDHPHIVPVYDIRRRAFGRLRPRSRPAISGHPAYGRGRRREAHRAGSRPSAAAGDSAAHRGPGVPGSRVRPLQGDRASGPEAR